MEGVAASQSSDVVVIFKGIDADGTGVAGAAQTLGRERSIDMLVVVFVIRVVVVVIVVVVVGLRGRSGHRQARAPRPGWLSMTGPRSMFLSGSQPRSWSLPARAMAPSSLSLS